MDDQETTKAQGSALGAVAGVIIGEGLGALVGLASGGSTEDVLAGAVIGGVAGGVTGGVAGYQYGMAVAQRKAEYADSEDFYMAEIAEIDASTQSIRATNEELSQQVSELEDRKAYLESAFADGMITKRAFQTEFSGIRREARELRRQAAPVEDLVNYQRAVVNDAQESGTSDEVALELFRASSEQEQEYAPLEHTLQRLATVEKPTRG